MGHYTDNLFKRKKKPKVVHIDEMPIEWEPERLMECAIIRDGQLRHGFKTHADLRLSMGDDHDIAYSHVRGDTEGFYTNAQRFVSRREAFFVGSASGQIDGPARDINSDEVSW